MNSTQIFRSCLWAFVASVYSLPEMLPYLSTDNLYLITKGLR